MASIVTNCTMLFPVKTSALFFSFFLEIWNLYP